MTAFIQGVVGCAVQFFCLSVSLEGHSEGLRTVAAEARAPRVDVRAVLVNCDSKIETAWGARGFSAFEKEELYRHNVLRDCRKKVTLTLKLQADANQEPGDVYVWVESAYDAQSSGNVPLLNPYVLRLRQEPVLQAYNLTYITIVDGGQERSENKDRDNRVTSEQHQLFANSHLQKEGSRRGKRAAATGAYTLDARDPRRRSFSVKIGEHREDSPVVVHSLHETTRATPAATAKNANDCGLEVCTELASVAPTTHKTHHKPTHRAHVARASPPHVHPTHHHTTTTTATTKHVEPSRHHETTTADQPETDSDDDSSEPPATKLSHAPLRQRNSSRIKRQHKSYPEIVINDPEGSAEDDSSKDGNKMLEHEKRTSDNDATGRNRELENNETNEMYNYIERADVKKASERASELDDAKEVPVEYSMYSIGAPTLWYSASIQLFEKQASPDGDSVWYDVMGGVPLSIGTLTPEVREASDVSVRYRPEDCLRVENFLLPVPGKLLLLVPHAASAQEKFQDSVGEFLVAPASAIADSKQSRLKHNRHTPSSALSNEQMARVLHDAKPLTSAIHVPTDAAGGAVGGGAAHALVRRQGESYLALPHPLPYRAQIDLEARADTNEILRLDMPARISKIVVDGSDRRRCLVSVQIGNTGLLSAKYSIALSDCPASMADMVAAVALPPPALLPPRHTRRFQLELVGPLPAEGRCSLSVLNDKGDLAAIRGFTVRRDDRCFCVWHCECACLERSPQLLCVPLPLERLAASGLGVADAPRRARAVCYSDNHALDALLLLVGLMLMLLMLGVLKAVLGLVSPCTGVWGLERLIELPRPIVAYHEPWLRHRPVLYDDFGWPVHPDTEMRSVRIMALKTQFCLNTVFFLTFPCAVLWSLVWMMTNWLSPCCSERCQNCPAKPSPSPCYAWTQRAEIELSDTQPLIPTALVGMAQACSGVFSMDDTAEESDTNYVLTQMQKSKESLAKSDKKRGQTSSRSHQAR